MRRLPHGGTTRPGPARPGRPYGQVPRRPGPDGSGWHIALANDIVRWADAVDRLLTGCVAPDDALEAHWVLDVRSDRLLDEPA